MKERVLVIAPHPDDEIIGCGGTMAQHVEKGDRIFVIYVTSGEIFEDEISYCISRRRRYDEAKEAADIIGFEILDFSNIPARRVRDNESAITDKLENIFRKLKPTSIYLPHDDEKDSDHIAVNSIVKEAYFRSKLSRGKDSNTVKAKLRGYEVWTPIKNISELNNIEDYANIKAEAIEKYKSQLVEIDYTLGIQGLNNYRGCFFGNCESAEVFTIIII